MGLDDPTELRAPAARARGEHTPDGVQADDTTELMEYELDQALREADAKFRAHPDRCHVGYAAAKRLYRR